MNNLTNKEIVFLFELLKDFINYMEAEQKETNRQKGYVEALVNYSKSSEKTKAKFIDFAEKITEASNTVIDTRKSIIIPLMQKFEAMYDMIAEAEPELQAEMQEVVNSENLKNHLSSLLNEFQNDTNLEG